MVREDSSMNTDHNAENIVLILLGALSGAISLGILTDYIQANPWLSPILGVLAILLLSAGGFLATHDHKSRPNRTR